jgi:hypothetical protein
MNDNTTTEVPNLRDKTQAELLDPVNVYAKKHGPPTDSYDGAKNTLFGCLGSTCQPSQFQVLRGYRCIAASSRSV